MKGFCDKPQFAYMYINLGSNNLYKLLFIYLWKKLNKKTSVHSNKYNSSKYLYPATHS